MDGLTRQADEISAKWVARYLRGIAGNTNAREDADG